MLLISDYERAHDPTGKQYVLVDGHLTPEIERVVEELDELSLLGHPVVPKSGGVRGDPPIRLVKHVFVVPDALEPVQLP